MSIGSLFSGIGGLEYGLEAAGFGPVVFQVEIDAFCRNVLAKHWPDADRSVIDVCKAGIATLPKVDLLCGGFPCVETSSAGSRKGMDGDVSGPLWREYKRVIDELRPRIAVVENPSDGEAWHHIVSRDLWALGYNTAALALSAKDVGAPHRRERIFVIAMADSLRDRLEDGRARRATKRATSERDAGGGRAIESNQSRMGGNVGWLSARLDGHRWPNGRGEAQHEEEPPRTSAPRSVPNRAARVKALGNAVVPQCALVVGRWIREVLS